VVGEGIVEGKSVMKLEDALKLAADNGLDLVQVSSNCDNVVCKIMDYNKFIYRQKKIEKNNRKPSQELKEIRIGNYIADHDLKIKAKQVDRILGEGDKVKVTILFKGRTIRFANDGIPLLHKVLNELTSKYSFDKEPKIEGDKVYMILAPSTYK